MPEITETFHPMNRAEWRAWLEENHATKDEIWLVYYKQATGKPRVQYIESVLEAICFGWIDGIAKTIDDERTAQRFTPRRPKGNWTELNKERARRLIDAGLMTDAGLATLPDLSLEAFTVADDILQVLQADAQVWANFQAFPGLYQRVRIDNIEAVRRNEKEFQRRLDKFITHTREGKMYGRWEE
jgi:uncharacterized protein YdeI (YjbR/CyaY-like superfamily)